MQKWKACQHLLLLVLMESRVKFFFFFFFFSPQNISGASHQKNCLNLSPHQIKSPIFFPFFPLTLLFFLSTRNYLCALFKLCNQAPAPTSDGVCAEAFYDSDVRLFRRKLHRCWTGKKDFSNSFVVRSDNYTYKKNVDFFPNVWDDVLKSLVLHQQPKDIQITRKYSRVRSLNQRILIVGD